VAQVCGVVLRLGGEVVEGCACVDGSREGEEGGERNGRDGGGDALELC
jgi:hypothetical protein